MFTRIQALRFRCLRSVDQELGRFMTLVGPNASGKTTFLDAVAFLSDLVSHGLDYAIESRTRNFQDLLFAHQGERFELAVELQIPSAVQDKLHSKSKPYDTVRYEVGIEYNAELNEVRISAEKGSLRIANGAPPPQPQKSLFPEPEEPPAHIVSTAKASQRQRTLFSKKPGGNDNYYAEAQEREGRWAPAFKLGPRKSTLGNLPEDESNFPVSTWLKHFLANGVERFMLNSQQMRLASPPGQGSGFRADGSNLPWVVEALKKNSPERFRDWTDHLQTALPDLETIDTVVRSDDLHRYLVLKYTNNLQVPSWMASDGTLRLLALTLPAYLRGSKSVFLIEEPENGIHPQAMEAVFQSMSSVYDSQILVATHSPVILSLADPAVVLCFAKTADGATDIVVGNKHPRLAEWQEGEQKLGVLFAAGVLS